MDLTHFQVQYRREAESELVTTTLAEVNSAEVLRGVAVRVPPSFVSQRHYPGDFWSATTGRTHVYESLLELDRLWLADFDTHTTALLTQQFRVTGPDGSRLRRHVPDLLLATDNGGTVLVDVKSKSMLEKPEVQEQFAWTARWCRAMSWRYEVFSGGDPVVLRNIKYLSEGRRLGLIPHGAVKQVHEVGSSGMTLGALETTGSLASLPGPALRQACFCLLWFGRWRTDLRRPIGPGSVIHCGDAL